MYWYIALLVAGYLIFRVLKLQYYWSGKDVIQGPQIPLFGNMFWFLLRQESSTDNMHRMYFKFPKERYCGMYGFTLPFLMVRDPEMIKQISIKDFDHFTDHRPFIPDDIDPLFGRNLLSLRGEPWRNMRSTLSPAFTSSKMKIMFSVINEGAEQFTDYFTKQDGAETVFEMKDAFSRFASDMIATCAFGVKCDSLKDRNNEFYTKGVRFTNFSSAETVFAFFLSIISPALTKFLDLRIITKSVATFFHGIITDTIRMREEQNIFRPDMLHLLIEARKGVLKHEEEIETKQEGFAAVEESHIGKVDKKILSQITDLDITAQALIFFFAGSDTVSTILSFASYELAIHPEIQDKLYEEINNINSECNRRFTYDAISKMPYMDMVISEALRKWPPMAGTDRVCVKPWTMEPTKPGESVLHLDVGDLVMFPTYGIHHDPKYFPEPERFDPERFSEKNKHNIVPYSYLPFGLGPRSCIGSRFALVILKTVMFNLLLKFELTVTDKTSIPMKLSKSSLTMHAANGIWLGLKKRKSLN